MSRKWVLFGLLRPRRAPYSGAIGQFGATAGWCQVVAERGGDMDTDERSRTALWRDIDALLAHARVARPLHCADALLDLTRVAGCATAPPIARLAEALDGWDGRLLVAVPDDALAPAVRAGERVVIDPAAESREGGVVLAFAGGGLVLRRLTWRDGRQWLVAACGAATPLGPEVAILGVAVELRRALDGCLAA